MCVCVCVNLNGFLLARWLQSCEDLGSSPDDVVDSKRKMLIELKLAEENDVKFACKIYLFKLISKIAAKLYLN